MESTPIHSENTEKQTTNNKDADGIMLQLPWAIQNAQVTVMEQARQPLRTCTLTLILTYSPCFIPHPALHRKEKTESPQQELSAKFSTLLPSSSMQRPSSVPTRHRHTHTLKGIQAEQ